MDNVFKRGHGRCVERTLKNENDGERKVDGFIYFVLYTTLAILKFLWGILKATGLHVPFTALVMISFARDGMLPIWVGYVGVYLFLGWVIYVIIKFIKWIRKSFTHERNEVEQ